MSKALEGENWKSMEANTDSLRGEGFPSNVDEAEA